MRGVQRLAQVQRLPRERAAAARPPVPLLQALPGEQDGVGGGAAGGHLRRLLHQEAAAHPAAQVARRFQERRGGPALLPGHGAAAVQRPRADGCAAPRVLPAVPAAQAVPHALEVPLSVDASRDARAALAAAARAVQVDNGARALSWFLLLRVFAVREPARVQPPVGASHEVAAQGRAARAQVAALVRQVLLARVLAERRGDVEAEADEPALAQRR
mmetsp:Transcript_4062/g.10886  ORF Transcript_4062/g.10886 Transcript_4062/m.10886 type:complete len:216 (-) Transcript_4062:1105-1752(-)